MRRYLLSLLLFFIFLTGIRSQTESPRVSILTCSPGNEVYSLFGHTALRYKDDAKGLDLIFNYGVFDFSAPNFIWRFVLGETDYRLAVIDFPYFIGEYTMRGSGVVEQVLDVDSATAKRLFDALLVNYRRENRVYRYNYFYNNCTTKARDMALSVMGDSVSYNDVSSMHRMTFREIIHHFTVGYPWYTFGMDLLLGAGADRVAGVNAQFAPYVLLHDFRGAVVWHSGKERPLLSEEKELIKPLEKAKGRSNFTPFNASLLLLLFTFVIMSCERRSKKTYLIWDIMLMGLQGIAGCVLLFMALFSQHPMVNENYLLLLLNPLPLIILPFLCSRVRRSQPVRIMYVQVAMVLLFFILSLFLPQHFPVAIYICATALLVRAWFHLNKQKICDLD